MSRGDEFLARWSRLKRAAAQAEVPVQVPARPVAEGPLPEPASLNFDSDFSAFLGDQVEAGLKYRALSKLFHSPQFNVMDGLDIYIDDYSLPDPVSEELLKNLSHARDLLADRPAPVTTTSEAVAGEGAAVAEEKATEDMAIDENAPEEKVHEH
jgi:hypothetical protein